MLIIDIHYVEIRLQRSWEKKKIESLRVKSSKSYSVRTTSDIGDILEKFIS